MAWKADRPDLDRPIMEPLLRLSSWGVIRPISMVGLRRVTE